MISTDGTHDGFYRIGIKLTGNFDLESDCVFGNTKRGENISILSVAKERSCKPSFCSDLPKATGICKINCGNLQDGQFNSSPLLLPRLNHDAGGRICICNVLEEMW
jgi:hypothetical protein